MNFSAIAKHKTAILVTSGVLVGLSALGAGALAVWNCEKMRTYRAAKRTGRIMSKVGAAMQAIASIVGE